METTTAPQLLTIGEAARRLELSPNWLRTLTNAGRVPHIRSNAERLYDPAVIDALAEERRRNPPIVGKHLTPKMKQR